jgi:hypothetical protein
VLMLSAATTGKALWLLQIFKGQVCGFQAVMSTITMSCKQLCASAELVGCHNR